MVKFAEVFPDEQIVSTLSQQLSWSYFVTIIYLKEYLKRDFYAEMCRIKKWNVRTLRNNNLHDSAGMIYLPTNHLIHCIAFVASHFGFEPASGLRP